MAVFGEIETVINQCVASEKLSKALCFTKDLLSGTFPDLQKRAASLKAGESFEVELQGRDVYAIFQAYVPRRRKDGAFEAHREYTDIQLLLSGEEFIEVMPLQAICHAPVYDDKGNVFFPLRGEAVSRVCLRPGIVAVLFPNDAHAPTLQAGTSTALNVKVVVKIRTP